MERPTSALHLPRVTLDLRQLEAERSVPMESTPLIAFDQHAATKWRAVLLPGQQTPALHNLVSDTPTLLRFVKRMVREGGVQCCYEAGPCGFELQRAFTQVDG